MLGPSACPWSSKKGREEGQQGWSSGYGEDKLRGEGVGSTVDVLFFALVITLASFLLLQITPSGGDIEREDYAARLAQSTLISFQRTPVGELSEFSYTPDLPIKNPSERRLSRKTITQLIAEDVLMNPQFHLGGRSVTLTTNREFDQELTDFLRKALDKFVGDRFDYRLIVQMPKIKLSGEGWVYFRKVIEDFDRSSELIRSESIPLNFAIPSRWDVGPPTSSSTAEPLGDKQSSSQISRSSEGTATVIITLELWSK